ncbi:MAG: hypothetical protein ACK5LV_04355 [Lachnospirales bacterium]
MNNTENTKCKIFAYDEIIYSKNLNKIKCHLNITHNTVFERGFENLGGVIKAFVKPMYHNDLVLGDEYLYLGDSYILLSLSVKRVFNKVHHYEAVFKS